MHSANLVDERGRHLGVFNQRIAKSGCYPPLSFGPWFVFYGFSMVFRRELLEWIDPALRGRHTFEWDELLSHDLWVYFLATSLGRVAAERRPLADYRQHGANQTPHLLGGGLQRWTSSFGPPVDPRLPRNGIARDRAVLLQDLAAATTDAHLAESAGLAAEYWRRIARFEDARIDFYGRRRWPGRPGSF